MTQASDTTPAPKRDVLRATDAAAIRLAKTLLRSARHGAIAAIEAQTGAPLASRVGVGTDHDGTPIIRYYADGTGNWYGNADTFSDGASAQFGAGGTGRHRGPGRPGHLRALR